MKKLKECPFCGIIPIWKDGVVYHQVLSDCPLSHKYITSESWNTRVEPTKECKHEWSPLVLESGAKCIKCQAVLKHMPKIELQGHNEVAEVKNIKVNIPIVCPDCKNTYYGDKCVICNPSVEPHKCTCNRHPDSVFTVTIVNGLSMCPRCGGVCIPARLERLDDKNKLWLIKRCREMILAENPEMVRASLLKPIKYFIDELYERFGTPVLPTEEEILSLFETFQMSTDEYREQDFPCIPQWNFKDLIHYIHQAMKNKGGV